MTEQSVVKAVVYVRYLTARQNRRPESVRAEQDLDAQLRPLLELLRHRDWQLQKIYSDRTSSNKQALQGLQNLMEDARRGEFQVLIVWRLGCLAHGVKKLILTLDELFRLGVDVVCQPDEFDTTTSCGKKVQETIACLANIERAYVKEQVRAGVERARLYGTRSGRAIGRPKCSFDRERVMRLRRQGWSYRKIADELGIGLGTMTRTLCETSETVASEAANEEVQVSGPNAN